VYDLWYLFIFVFKICGISIVIRMCNGAISTVVLYCLTILWHWCGCHWWLLKATCLQNYN